MSFGILFLFFYRFDTILKNYFLFIDTETTGIPKRWDLPYSDIKNWPSAVQISWLIFDENKDCVKKENFYINEDDLKISSKSFKIHGISTDFLKENGVSRKLVLERLSDDVKTYNPLITGHFTEFDIHTLSCDFYRAGLENPFLQSPFFCTMLKSREYVNRPEIDCLRLSQLSDYLFDEPMVRCHDAMIDAEMTAKCFFEIQKRGDLSENEFQKIHQEIQSKLMFLSKKLK